jgi:Protein of unknown function (DUF1579)
MRINIWILAGIVLLAGRIAMAQEERPAELKLLDKWAGNWEKSVELPDGQSWSAEVKSHWVLGDSHLASSLVLNLPDGKKLEQHILTTWDGKANAYKTYTFSSRGSSPLISTGTWDEKTKTMTATGQLMDNGMVINTVTKLATDDRMEWTIEGKDANGNVTFTFKGVDTRKK